MSNLKPKLDLTSPSDPSLSPGEARCPGPSMQEVIATDATPTPEALKAESYEFLGDADIPYSRFTDKDFFEAEIDKVWGKTWQWACREEHIPNKGDYYVYDVGPYSAMVVRTTDNQIKAYINACPHRAMMFADPGSSGKGKQFIRCPYHGMSWHLDGSLREIPCRWDFPHVDEDNFALTEIPTDTWGGFVFVNFDANAEPLVDYLEVLPEHYKELGGLENRYVALHTQKLLPANWKTVIEAFLEAYHVLATHPEGVPTAGDANAQYDVFGKHVNRFMHLTGYPSPHYPREMSQEDLFERLGRKREDLPRGASARSEHARLVREEYSQEWGTDLSGYSDSQTLDSIEYYLFPSACFFPGLRIRLVYRFRPVDVDHTIHEILLLQPVPENGERPAPAEPHVLGIDDSYTQVPGFELAMVLDQDTENFKRQSLGIKASAKAGQTLGNYQEVRIRHMHQTLDEYLAR